MANVNALKGQAAKLVVQGNYAKALGIYEKVKELDPDEPGTYNLIGDVYLKMGQKENAVSEFKEALDLYKKVQYYPNAIAVCKKILRTDKEQTNVYKDLADLYVERGFIGEAVINYLEYASRMRNEGDKKQEIEAYRKVIELGPSKVDIRERLVDLYIAEGETQEAIEELEKIEELLIQQGKQSRLPEIEAKLATLKVGDIATKEEKKKEEVEEEEELSVQQGFTMQDMMDESVKVEEKVEKEKKEPEEEKPTVKKEKEESVTGEKISLEEEIAKMKASSVVSGAEHVTVENLPPPDKSELQSEPTQWTNFEELAELCLSVNSKNEAVDYLYKAGQMYMEENNYAKAVKIYRRIIDIRPLELRPRQKLIEISLKTEDTQSASEWNFDLGKCLHRKGALDEAEKAFSRAIDLTSKKDEMKKKIDKMKGKKPKEEEIEVETPEISLGELLEEEEKTTVKFTIADEKEVEEPVTFEDLLEEFKEGVLENIEDKDFDSHYDLGITYKEMGLLEEAILEFEKASRGDAVKLKSIEMLSLCLIEKGDLVEGEKVILDAVSTKGHKETELLGLRYNLAQIYERINKNEEAEKQFSIILKHDPEFRDTSMKMSELEERIKKQKQGTEKKEKKKVVERAATAKKKPVPEIGKKKEKPKEKPTTKKKVSEVKKEKAKRKKKISYI
jgi:tetratricopeptide (TPR) repeat protein